MNNGRIGKLENPIRLAELDAENTLKKAGFNNAMTLCDIGAGTGIFSFPAAKMSKNDIYALEKSEAMIDVLRKRIEERGITNLIVRKVETDRLPLEDKACDMALMATVLHEIDDKAGILNESKRILKEQGKLVIIEFHNRETPMGPPMDLRLSEEFVEGLCYDNGFKIKEKMSLGDNMYLLLFES